MTGARACYLAGAIATSNVAAGKKYGIPIKGTHAHSWVMSFPTELDAFRAYAKTFPKKVHAGPCPPIGIKKSSK
jgi:nicotinate phosphoribosyltransferase